MNFQFVRKSIAHLNAGVVAILVALALANCGGGGSDSSTTGTTKMIAPASLDEVRIDFFKAFTIDCYRLSGAAGNETGGCKYNRLQESFRLAASSGGSNLGTTMDLPVILTDMSYTYVRTGNDTGRVTFTFTNNQVYIQPALGGDMFWGGPNRLATELVIDVLFTDSAGSLLTNSTRIRSAYWVSKDTATPPVVTVIPWEFDSSDVTYRMLSGATVKTGYDPYATIKDNTSASAVWKSLQGRSVWFTGSDSVTRKVVQQSIGGSGPVIPGVAKVEESGAILIDSDTESVSGGGGTYSYYRTGGKGAKFAISYKKPDGSSVTLVYDMSFTSLDGGTYVDSAGVSGTFLQDLYTAL